MYCCGYSCCLGFHIGKNIGIRIESSFVFLILYDFCQFFSIDILLPRVQSFNYRLYTYATLFSRYRQNHFEIRYLLARKIDWLCEIENKKAILAPVHLPKSQPKLNLLSRK